MSAYDLQIAVYNELVRAARTTLSADFTTETYSLYSAKVESGLEYLDANIVGVYDNPAQVTNPEDSSAYPYITLSSDSGIPWDTDTEMGFDGVVFVHTWSRASHSLEAKQIQDAVYQVLHRGILTINGYTFIGSDMISQTIQRDPDGLTRHGVQEFRIIYDEE